MIILDFGHYFTPASSYKIFHNSIYSYPLIDINETTPNILFNDNAASRHIPLTKSGIAAAEQCA